MKNIIVPVVILVLFTSIGCVNDSNTKVQKADPPSTILELISDPNANKIPTNPPTTTPPTITSKPDSTVALNPAHGQPGHRCDIAVGAPLNSKPIQSTIQTPPTGKPTTPLNTSPVKTSPATGKGLNPAHGQPGHRCDIVVGAPLDSKPIQTTTQTQSAGKTITTPPLSIPSATGDGLNPAHGQPGHRCDIAVGSPLNSKPTPKQ